VHVKLWVSWGESFKRQGAELVPTENFVEIISVDA
jgi:hypothetical protein